MEASLTLHRYAGVRWEWPNKAALWLIKKARFLLGIVGIFLVIPFLCLLLLMGYLAIRLGTAYLKRSKDQFVDRVGTMESREQIETHLAFQRLVLRLASQQDQLSELKSPWLFSGYVHRMEQFYSEIAQMEVELRRLVYPEAESLPTPEDTKRLQKAFEEFQDWDDPALDVYDQYPS